MDNFIKLSTLKRILIAVTVILLLIVAAFLINNFNNFNAYYINPMKYCLIISFIGILLFKTEKPNWLIILFALFNAIVLTYLELEMWQGNNLAEPFDGYEMMRIRLMINYFLIFGVILFFSFISGNLKRGIITSAVIFYILGFISYLVVEFRGEVLLPADLTALKTAVNVAESYQIPLKSNIFSASLCFFTILIWALNIRIKLSNNVQVRNRLLYGILSLLVFWSFNFFEFENYYYPWFVPNNGYIFAIANNLKSLNIHSDENYSNENVRTIITANEKEKFFEGYNANEAIKEKFPEYEGSPNIICIMNESFTYFSQFDNFLRVDKEIAPYINSIKDETIQGDLIVEVFGGGTSDTEFTFFTGLSTKLFPLNARAYELYINENTPSVIKNLKKQGYETIAIHPDKAENWNRNNVYPYLGFDQFITVDSFNSPEIIRDIFISDRESYKKIEELYEQKKDQPLFIFDLTIQNHGSYDQSFNNLDKVNVNNNLPKLEQFISLVNESDKAFKELVEYFDKANEPTIICMFGDHLPKLDSELYTEILGIEGASDLMTQRLQYTTPFIIWANFRLPKDEIDVISINYLSTMLLELSGNKLTPYNNYLINLYHKFPVIDKKGVLDNNYNDYFYNELDKSDQEIITNYNNIIYNYLFEKNNTNIDLYNIEE